MSTAINPTAGAVPDWRAEALALSCPYCGVQPPENCHGEPGELAEFPGPGHRIIKMHAPRWRQLPGYAARIHEI